MIDGLRLTMAGEDVRALLAQRVDAHRQCAENWRRDMARTPEEQTEDDPRFPKHICANEAERHEWRAEVLEFVRDHIEDGE